MAQPSASSLTGKVALLGPSAISLGCARHHLPGSLPLRGTVHSLLSHALPRVATLNGEMRQGQPGSARAALLPEAHLRHLLRLSYGSPGQP